MQLGHNKLSQFRIFTSIFGVDEEFIELIGHTVRQSFAINFNLARVADLRFADVNLERRVGDVLAVSIDVHQIITDFAWGEGYS